MDSDYLYIVLVCSLPLLGYFGPKLLTRIRMSSKAQFTPARQGVIFGKDEVEPTPVPYQIEIGPSLKAVLLAFIGVLVILAQGYVVYITRETKAVVQDVKVDAAEARSEATRALIQGEKNGERLKKQADFKLSQENRYRDLKGLPPAMPEVED